MAASAPRAAGILSVLQAARRCSARRRSWRTPAGFPPRSPRRSGRSSGFPPKTIHGAAFSVPLLLATALCCSMQKRLWGAAGTARCRRQGGQRLDSRFRLGRWRWPAFCVAVLAGDGVPPHLPALRGAGEGIGARAPGLNPLTWDSLAARELRDSPSSEYSASPRSAIVSNTLVTGAIATCLRRRRARGLAVLRVAGRRLIVGSPSWWRSGPGAHAVVRVSCWPVGSSSPHAPCRCCSTARSPDPVHQRT